MFTAYTPLPTQIIRTILLTLFNDIKYITKLINFNGDQLRIYYLQYASLCYSRIMYNNLQYNTYYMVSTVDYPCTRLHPGKGLVILVNCDRKSKLN